MSKKPNAGEINQEVVENPLSRMEWFIETHQKTIIAVFASIIILVGGYWGYQQFHVTPQTEEAKRQIFFAQIHFGNDEFRLALDGDAINPGFLEIIDNFGGTSVGKLARYYAGISHLHLGEYPQAIEHLKRFNTRDEKLKTLANGAIGDAYLELGERDRAIEWYTKATEFENDVTTPFFLLKLGVVLEEKGERDQALNVFIRIRDQFPNSVEARDIDKYIVRASL